jgi:hypothetical protein
MGMPRIAACDFFSCQGVTAEGKSSRIPSAQEGRAIMMTKQRIVQGLTVAVALVFGAVTASASDFKYNYNFDVFLMGGGSSLFRGTDFTSADEQYHANYAKGYKFAGGIGIPVGQILEVEATYTTGSNNLQLTNDSLTPRQLRSYGVVEHMGSLDAVGHAPVARWGFHPYAAAGLDYTRYAPTAAGNQVAATYGWAAVTPATLAADIKLGMNVGFGVERKLAPHVTFRLDIRDHITSAPNFGLAANAPTAPIFPVSGYAQNVVYTAGIVVHFEKKK